ncbi:MAG: tetratricopeptide repeat protein [Planctomycetaceae bacterium]
MSGKTLVALFTALTLAGSSGCQMGAGSSVTGLFSGRGEGMAGEELSPEFREAQKTFRRNTPKALLSWARYQEDVGEYSEALRRYRELTVAYPENIEAHLGLARVENTTGRFEQAEEILKKLASQHPDNTQIRLELGQLYSQREDWNSATVAFEQACRISPHDQTCRYELGIALARNGLLEQALPHLTFAVGGPAAHYNIGYLLHEEGEDAEAAEWLQQALSMHPDQKTADQSRRLLATLDLSDGGATRDVAEVPTSRRSPVASFDAATGRAKSSPERLASRAGAKGSGNVAPQSSGIQRASWSEEAPRESRLRGVKGVEGEQNDDLRQPASAKTLDATRPGTAVQSTKSAATKPLDPPSWRSARPLSN